MKYITDESRLGFHSFVCTYMWLLVVVGPIRIVYIILTMRTNWGFLDLINEIVLWALAIIVAKGLGKRTSLAWKCLVWRQSFLLIHNIVSVAFLYYIASIGEEVSYEYISDPVSFAIRRIIVGLIILVYYWRRKPLFTNSTNNTIETSSVSGISANSIVKEKESEDNPACDSEEDRVDNYMFCRRCGKKMESDSKFCRHCGTEVIYTKAK